MTGLVILFGVLWAFAGLQREVLAQKTDSHVEEVANVRAIERLESLVSSLNESLHETKEDLWEVRLCLNQTKKTLEEVQREKAILEAELVETRRDLTAKVGAMETKGAEVDEGMDHIRKRVRTIEKKRLPRKLDEVIEDVAEITKDLRSLENQMLPRRVNESFARLVNAEQDITVIQQEIVKGSRLADRQQEDMNRLNLTVTRQGRIINQLSDSVTEQGERLNRLNRAVARLTEDAATNKSASNKSKSNKHDSTSTPKGLRSTYINDTVFSNPVYTVPILNTTDGRHRSGTVGFPMCYEVQGQRDSYFNLISDCCTSVNAHYVAASDPIQNVIKVIGVVATDRGNETHYIKVEVNSKGFCEAQMDGQALVNNGTEIMGVSVHHENKLVTISVPNCSPPNEQLVMWVYCQILLIRSNPQTMIKYIINRSLQQRPTAHGLIGQFWGIPFKMVSNSEGNLILTMYPPYSARNRTIFASVAGTTWTQNGVPAIPNSWCLFVGSSQGGPFPPHYDSLIEGYWHNYTTDGLFETAWTYSRFSAANCGKGVGSRVGQQRPKHKS